MLLIRPRLLALEQKVAQQCRGRCATRTGSVARREVSGLLPRLSDRIHLCLQMLKLSPARISLGTQLILARCQIICGFGRSLEQWPND